MSHCDYDSRESSVNSRLHFDFYPARRARGPEMTSSPSGWRGRDESTKLTKVIAEILISLDRLVCLLKKLYVVQLNVLNE